MKKGDLVRLSELSDTDKEDGWIDPDVGVRWHKKRSTAAPPYSYSTNFPRGSLAIYLYTEEDEVFGPEGRAWILIEGRVGWVWGGDVEPACEENSFQVEPSLPLAME